MNKNKKNIPPINYLILIIVCIATILSTIYFFKIQEYKNIELTSESYLLSTSTVSLTINTLDELETILIEKPYDLFIYTGYTGDLDEYKLEEDLKNIIDDYSLSDRFYYLDITELKNYDNLFEELSSILNTTIDNYPVIIYISNDEVVNKIDSKDKIFEATDFEKLLEIYEFEKSK